MRGWSSTSCRLTLAALAHCTAGASGRVTAHRTAQLPMVVLWVTVLLISWVGVDMGLRPRAHALGPVELVLLVPRSLDGLPTGDDGAYPDDVRRTTVRGAGCCVRSARAARAEAPPTAAGRGSMTMYQLLPSPDDGKVDSKGLSKPLTSPSRPWPRLPAKLGSRQTPPPQTLSRLSALVSPTAQRKMDRMSPARERALHPAPGSAPLWYIES